MWFERPREITGRIEGGCSEFTIDCRLKSAGHIDGDYTAGENNPPMPFAFAGLGLYRLGHHYLLHDGTSKLSIEFGKPEELARITIIQAQGLGASLRSGSGQARITVLLDGVEVGSHARPSDIEGAYSIGRGFMKRYWRGDIDFVDFLPRALTIAPTLKGARLTGGRDLIKGGHRAGFPTT